MASEAETDIVIQYRVEQTKADSFKGTVAAAIGAKELARLSGVRDDEVRIRLLQAVISSDRCEWELRITLPSMEAFGRFMDEAAKPGEGDAKSLLGRLTGIEGAEVIDGGVPIYRAWLLPGVDERPQVT